MKQEIINLLNKFNTWKEAKVKESKQPLSRESAYALSSIKKKRGSYSDVTEDFINKVFKDINTAASYGDTYLLYMFPSHVSTSMADILVERLIKLDYKVCYRDYEVILISWKYPSKDS